MKATGIVRRIDDLGRVVIPKEIRRTLRIREGDPLEIFTDREGGVILKKYSPIGELTDFSKEYAESLQQAIGHIILISDKDAFVSVSGASKKDYIERKISNELEGIMDGRKATLIVEEGKTIPLHNDEDAGEYSNQVIAPIIAEGDAIGAVMILSKTPGEDRIETCRNCSSFFRKTNGTIKIFKIQRKITVKGGKEKIKVIIPLGLK